MSDPTNGTAAPVYLTPRELAERFRVHPTQVRKWAMRGIRVGGVKVKLAADVIGDRLRFTEAAVDEFRAACRVAKLGPDAKDPQPVSPAQEQRRLDRVCEEAMRLCGIGPANGNPRKRKPR